MLRLFVAETTALCLKAADMHALSPLGTLAFARALTGGVLLGALAKSERNINVQLASDGPLGTVFIDAFPDGTVRGYVSKNPGLAPIALGGRPSVKHGFGSQGFVNVLRADQNNTYFRGTVQLKGGEVDDDMTEYLMISEQVESAMVLDAIQDDAGRIIRAAGVLVQALPSLEPVSLEHEREALKDGVLYRALGKDGWIDEILAKLGIVEQGGLEEREVGWFCNCSDTRVGAALMAAGVEELSDMIAKEGFAEIHCDFCRKRYYFDRDQLAKLRDLAVGAALSHEDPADEGDN